jgi:hypothetical protein
MPELRWRWGLGLLLAVALAADLVALTVRFLPPMRATLPSAQVLPVAGAAYYAPVPGPGLPYWIPSDAPAADRRSRLRLFEDGVPQGLLHAVHVDIAREGRGRYSHWRGGLIFSSSDSSDPRSNGRRYEIEAPRALSPLAWCTLAVLNVLAGWTLVHLGAPALRWRRAGLAVWVGAALLVAAAGEGPGGGGPDAGLVARELVTPALAAALLGVVGCLAQATAGAGLVVLLRGREASASEAVLLGYPLGLTVAALAAATGLALPGGGAAAIGLTLLCGAPLLRWRPSRAALADLARTALVALPAALMLGVVLGLLWHPPTATLPAAPMGDLVFYSAKAWALEAQPWPHYNFGLEGSMWGYRGGLPSALAALVLRAGGPEPQWLMAAAVPAFAALALALVLRAAALDGRAGGSPLLAMTVALLAASGSRYASWIAESPPVAHMLPLIVSVTWLTWRAAGRFWPLAGAGATAVVGCTLSKVTALPVLGAMTGFALLAALGRRRTAATIGATLLGGLLVAALGLSLLYHYGRLFVAVAPLGPESWRQIVPVPGGLAWLWPLLVRDLGVIALGVAGTALGMEAGVATLAAAGLFLALPFVFTTSQSLACLVVASFALLGSGSRRALAVIALAASPQLVWILAFDLDSWWAPLAWVGAMGGIGLLAVAAPGRARDAWIVAGAGLAVTAGLLAAVATGRLAVDAGAMERTWGALTPAVREVWAQVRALVPRDAIVFTDMVAGPADATLTGGWNTYAASGQRQIWISNWYGNELRADPAAAAARIEANRAVLDGRLAPAALRLSRRYSEAWAVVRVDARVPPGWERRFANRDWAIWRIGPVGG